VNVCLGQVRFLIIKLPYYEVLFFQLHIWEGQVWPILPCVLAVVMQTARAHTCLLSLLFNVRVFTLSQTVLCVQ